MVSLNYYPTLQTARTRTLHKSGGPEVDVGVRRDFDGPINIRRFIVRARERRHRVRLPPPPRERLLLIISHRAIVSTGVSREKGESATGGLTDAFYVSRCGIKRVPNLPRRTPERARASTGCFADTSCKQSFALPPGINCSYFYAPVSRYSPSRMIPALLESGGM